MDDQESHRAQAIFGPAEIGALAHLYRGEMYQSKVWRNRLDTTTNCAVIITGIALSVAFSNADASPIPILLVSWLVIVFLLFEARRYLYYDGSGCVSGSWRSISMDRSSRVRGHSPPRRPPSRSPPPRCF